MSKADRWFYRAVKGVYTNTPAPRREAYLDSALAIRQAISDKLNKVQESGLGSSSI